MVYDFRLFIKPMMHQIEAVKFIITRYASLICFQTGTGKSILGILSCFKLIKEGMVEKAIFVGTVSSCLEIVNDFKEKTNYVPFEIKNQDDFLGFLNDPNKLIGVFQYEAINKISLPILAKQLAKKKTLWLLDEIHKLKTPTAKLRTKFGALRNLMTFCVGLTATPLTSKLYDLYYVVEFLDPRIFGNKSKFTYNFVNVRMKDLANGGRYPEIQGYKNLNLLSEYLKPIMLTYYPKQNVNYILKNCELEPEDKKEYKVASRGIMDDGDTKMHASRLIDLQRILNHSEAKKECFKQTILEIKDSGAIVYCHFHETIDIIEGVLDQIGVEYKSISGDIKAKERKNIKDWFNKNPSNKVLLITSAGSQSLNLQSTNKLVFYDIPFGFGAFSQTRGRICRIFSEHSEFDIYFILCKDTLDEYKYILVSSYKSLTETIFESDVVPKSDLQSYNAKLLKMQRNSLLWK